MEQARVLQSADDESIHGIGLRVKAIVYQQYGGPEVLELGEVPQPTPGEGQVLVKVHATSINAADYRMMRADPFLVRFVSGLFRPTRRKILGMDVENKNKEEETGETRRQSGKSPRSCDSL